MNSFQVLTVTLIVLVVIVILLSFNRQSRTDEERDENRGKLLLIGIIVVFGVAMFLFAREDRNGESNSRGLGEETGVFSRKKASIPTPAPTSNRTNYGNPMKQQSYISRSAIPTTAKTDTSKIYRTFKS